MLISITSAGLGFREIVIGTISKMIGHQLTEGVIVASLDRVVAMFWVFLLGGVFSYLLISKSRVSESGGEVEYSSKLLRMVRTLENFQL